MTQLCRRPRLSAGKRKTRRSGDWMVRIVARRTAEGRHHPSDQTGGSRGPPVQVTTGPKENRKRKTDMEGKRMNDSRYVVLLLVRWKRSIRMRSGFGSCSYLVVDFFFVLVFLRSCLSVSPMDACANGVIHWCIDRLMNGCPRSVSGGIVSLGWFVFVFDYSRRCSSRSCICVHRL